MLVCVFLCTSCTRDRGCSAHPAFPAPSVFPGAKLKQASGASRREIGMHVTLYEHVSSALVIARLDRAIQYSRDVSDRTEKPRRPGCPAFAGHDNSHYFSIVRWPTIRQSGPQ